MKCTHFFMLFIREMHQHGANMAPLCTSDCTRHSSLSTQIAQISVTDIYVNE